MLKQIKWASLSKTQQEKILERPIQQQDAEFMRQVQQVIDTVKSERDVALQAFTHKFDHVDLQTLQVSEQEFSAAMDQASPRVISAFEQVVQRLTDFHRRQEIPNYAIEMSPGIMCESQTRPIQRVGLYIPGGSAPLVSTVLMLGVPAQLAGCPERIICSPPNQKGELDPNMIVAAKLLGIEKIFKVGGAQAIAAMAYGTESVPKVDKIFGPGNSWVTTAKMLVSLDPKGAQLDLPAGPSEVFVIADANANPEFIAADLLSQAEHGVDSQVMLVCMSANLAEQVHQTIEMQLKLLSRAMIARASLEHSVCIIVDSIEQAIEIANAYAPEHLILTVEQPRKYLSAIHSVGSVFLGAWSPEAVGDYASGTNHVLPTCGFAKSCSGLSVRDFLKTLSVQELTREGLASIAETIRVLTDLEGLDAHQLAIDVRLKNTIEQLARASVLQLTPYSSARLESGQRKVHLDANENPFGCEKGLNRYPDPQPELLKPILSQLYGIDPEQLLMTRGSDEGIDLLMRVFCEPGRDAIMITPPTYGMYEVSAGIQGADIKTVPLLPDAGFALDVPALLAQWHPFTKLIFLCSPNNPTGNMLAVRDILELCERLQDRALVVVDEAYIEFSTAESLSASLPYYNNLVILRTLSKAYGLAGARFGCLLAHENIIALLKKVIAPYPISLPVIEAVQKTLSTKNKPIIFDQIQMIRLERERLFGFLASLPSVQAVYPSEANFLLVKVKDAPRWMSQCAASGLVIRSRENLLGLENCVRISVGTPDENQQLREVLSNV